MSVFDDHTISKLPPEIYFKHLCEDAFGFNLEEGTVYDRQFDTKTFVNMFAKICNTMRETYPELNIYFEIEGFGHMVCRYEEKRVKEN